MANVKGSCLCGSVTLEISAFKRQALACHCNQCRKQSGHYVVAPSVKDEDLTITGESHLTWYQASSVAKRGFCSRCGSLLFWKPVDRDETSVMAGCLDAPTGVEIKAHIFTDSKGDYYELPDATPQFPGDVP